MKKQRTFTLIELLVVISIIAILASMLLPSLARARYIARNSVCVSNLKQVAIMLISYADDNDSMYPDVWPEYTGTGSWYYAANTAKAQIHPEYFSCANKDKRPVITSYLAGPISSIFKCPLETEIMDKHNMDSSGYSNRRRGAYNIYQGGNTKFKHFYLKQRMRKTGDIFIPSSGTAGNLEFNIMASDIVKYESSTKIITTQMPFSGVRVDAGQWTNGPTGWHLYPDSRTYANYVLDDGSVHTYTNVGMPSTVGGGFVKAETGAGYYFPRELAE